MSKIVSPRSFSPEEIEKAVDYIRDNFPKYWIRLAKLPTDSDDEVAYQKNSYKIIQAFSAGGFAGNLTDATTLFAELLIFKSNQDKHGGRSYSYH
jgi:hypothetical protein